MMRTHSPRRENGTDDGTQVRPVVWRDVLPPQDCRAAVEAMARSTAVAGPVLRRNRDVVDPDMRRCAEHLLANDRARPVVDALRTVARKALGDEGWGRARLDGPKFCSYPEGGLFRAHRDSSVDHLDPAVVRGRRLTVVCLLNDAAAHDGLPSFEGGALVVYVPQPDGTVSPANVRPEAGSVVTFRSDLLHEVRPVRAGVRYAAVGWLHDVEDDENGNDHGPEEKR